MRFLSLIMTLLVGLSATSSSSASAGTAPVATQGRASFSFSGPLPLLLEALGATYGVNITAANIQGSPPISVSLRDVTLDTALFAVSHFYSPALTITKSNGLIVLTSQGASNGTNGPVVTHAFGPLTNTAASDIAVSVNQALQLHGGSVIADPRSNKLIYVGSPDGESVMTALIASFDAPAGTSGTRSAEIPLARIPAADAADALTKAFGGGTSGSYIFSVSVNKNANSVVLHGPQSVLAQARELLTALDTPPRQVKVAVRVYDLTPVNTQSSIGVQYGSGSASGGGTSFTPGAFLRPTLLPGRISGIEAQINAAMSSGHASVLASPNVTVSVDQEGKIQIGDQTTSIFSANTQSVLTQSFNAGIILSVTPIFISASGLMKLHIHAEFSQFTSFLNGIPQIATRFDDTTMYVQNGETVSLGGLTRDQSGATTTKVPILGDIPLFGMLFRNVAKTNIQEQLVFTITPTVQTMDGSSGS